MIEKIKGKKVKIGVAFMETMVTKYFAGVVDNCSTLGGENFIIFEDGNMINMKFIQTIEII